MGPTRPKPFDRRTSPQMFRTVLGPVRLGTFSPITTICFFNWALRPYGLIERPDRADEWPLAMEQKDAEAACAAANDLWFEFVRSLGRARA